MNTNKKKKIDKNIEVTIYMIIRIALVILLAVLIIGQFSSNAKSSTSIKNMSKAVTKDAPLSLMKKADNQMIKRLYRIEPKNYEGVILYYPKSNMGSEELFVIKLKDISQQEEVKKAIEARIAIQKKNFDGYGTYQLGMLKNSIVDIAGNYILFISSTNPQRINAAFKKGL